MAVWHSFRTSRSAKGCSPAASCFGCRSSSKGGTAGAERGATDSHWCGASMRLSSYSPLQHQILQPGRDSVGLPSCLACGRTPLDTSHRRLPCAVDLVLPSSPRWSFPDGNLMPSSLTQSTLHGKRAVRNRLVPLGSAGMGRRNVCPARPSVWLLYWIPHFPFLP